MVSRVTTKNWLWRNYHPIFRDTSVERSSTEGWNPCCEPIEGTFSSCNFIYNPPVFRWQQSPVSLWSWFIWRRGCESVKWPPTITGFKPGLMSSIEPHLSKECSQSSLERHSMCVKTLDAGSQGCYWIPTKGSVICNRCKRLISASFLHLLHRPLVSQQFDVVFNSSG